MSRDSSVRVIEEREGAEESKQSSGGEEKRQRKTKRKTLQVSSIEEKADNTSLALDVRAHRLPSG